MPRTSYGEGKKQQAWKLVAALLLARGESRSASVSVNGVTIDYRPGKAPGTLELEVRGTLIQLGKLSALSGEQVRESLTEHLIKFLGIAEDGRLPSQRAGRNAGNWIFRLRLWSTELAENQREFDALWQQCKSGQAAQNTTSSQSEEDGLEELVQQVKGRCHAKVLSLYSNITLFNRKQIDVEQIYVDVYVLEKLARDCWARLQDFEAIWKQQQDEKLWQRLERAWLGNRKDRLSGKEVAQMCPRLMILGKPGSGKTTFLRNLAVSCSRGQFQPGLIPVLIELRLIRNFATFRLLERVQTEFSSDASHTQAILNAGKVLLLLDGLDEVPNQFREQMRQEIEDFSQQFYACRMVTTCRTQTVEYELHGFNDVEVADFNLDQRQRFVTNWFEAGKNAPALWLGRLLKQPNSDDFPGPEKLLETIETNQRIRQLAGTPVLLS